MLMLTAIREAQLPLLAAVLLGACAAKIWRMLRSQAGTDHSDPSVLFPAHLRRPITVSAGLRAGPARLPVARARRDHGAARLLRAVRAAPDAGRPNHVRPACQRPLA